MMYYYQNHWYSMKDLSKLSGISENTIRCRLRRGYTLEQSLQDRLVDESVVMFNDASWYEDWIGMSTLSLYEIYWEWCVSNGYTPITQVCFTRQIMQMYPNLKTVPTKSKDGCSYRMIRRKS